MKVQIEIECDNDAFYPEPVFEVVRILKELWRMEELENKTLYDVNGNKVGFLKVMEDGNDV